MSESEFNCLICDEKSEYHSLHICNHDIFCMLCIIRCRTFYNDKKCPLCNIESPYVLITENPKEDYELLIRKKKFFYEDDDFKKNGVYFTDISSKEVLVQLRAFKCPIKSCIRTDLFNTLEELSIHMKNYHDSYFCSTCISHNSKFLQEQTVYTKKSLEDHIEFGDVQVIPHPKCCYCNELFFSNDELFEHMNTFHFCCQVCHQLHRKIFFSNIENLVKHHKSSHYYCPVKECVEDLYFAFATRDDLQAHFLANHPQIKLEENEGKPTDKMVDINVKKDEVDFDEYIEGLNRKWLMHWKNYKENQRKNQNSYSGFQGKNHNNQNKANAQKKIVNPKVFQYFENEFKAYIPKRIKEQKIHEEEVMLPRETVYQLIIMISKENNEQLDQFSFLPNFGVDKDNVKRMKEVFSKGTGVGQGELKDLFDFFTFKTLLLFYKYVSICYKKLTGNYYKKDFEEVKEDMYEEFIKRPSNEERNKFPSLINSQLNNNQKKKKKGKFKWSQKKVVGLTDSNKSNSNSFNSFYNSNTLSKKDKNKVNNDVKEKEKEEEEEEENEDEKEEEKREEVQKGPSQLSLLLNGQDDGYDKEVIPEILESNHLTMGGGWSKKKKGKKKKFLPIEYFQ